MARSNIRPNLILGIPERSGFLLPALTIWTAILIYFAARKGNIGISDLLVILQNKETITIVGLALLGIYTIFILGHIVDLLSNGVNERFLANKMNGYPHERIVPIEHTTSSFNLHQNTKKTIIKRASFFFEGAKLLIASTSLYVFIRIVERHPRIKQIPNSIEILNSIELYAQAGMIIACILSIPSAAIRYLPHRTRAARTVFAKNLSNEIKQILSKNKLLQTIETAWGIFSYATLAPLVFAYDAVDGFILGMIRITTGIDSKTFNQVQKAFKKHMGIDYVEVQNNDRFWLIYLSIHNNLPHMIGKIDQMKRFANFCRNQSFACFIAAMIFAGVYRNDAIGAVGLFSKNNICTLSICLFCFAWLFHWKFLHHYHSYTKLTYRSFSLLATIEKKKKQATDPDNNQETNSK